MKSIETLLRLILIFRCNCFKANFTPKIKLGTKKESKKLFSGKLETHFFWPFFSLVIYTIAYRK
jgi:hypothetical protein